MSYACGFLPTVFDEYPCSRLGSSTTSRVMSLSSRSLRRVAQAGQVPSGFLKKIALYTWWIKAQKRSNHRDFCISGSNGAKPIQHDYSILRNEFRPKRGTWRTWLFQKKKFKFVQLAPGQVVARREIYKWRRFLRASRPLPSVLITFFPTVRKKTPSSSASSIKEISASCTSYICLS